MSDLPRYTEWVSQTNILTFKHSRSSVQLVNQTFVKTNYKWIELIQIFWRWPRNPGFRIHFEAASDNPKAFKSRDVGKPTQLSHLESGIVKCWLTKWGHFLRIKCAVLDMHGCCYDAHWYIHFCVHYEQFDLNIEWNKIHSIFSSIIQNLWNCWLNDWGWHNSIFSFWMTRSFDYRWTAIASRFSTLLTI